MMVQHDYFLFDVFTDQRFCGNQLAIVSAPKVLADDVMQQVAREFNLSETIFINPPVDEHNTASVRIFTCSQELPFAGHPTVGAAVLLGLTKELDRVLLEERVGLVDAEITLIGEGVGAATFGLPKLPERVGNAPSVSELAVLIGVAADEIGCANYQPARYSAGVEYLLIPVRDADVLAKVHPHGAGWIYVFTQTPDEPDNDFAARMFTLGDSVVEDAATGSAAAALIGLIGQVEGASASYRVRQGHEMGRPSLIDLDIEMADGELKRARIGGRAVQVAKGTIQI